MFQKLDTTIKALLYEGAIDSEFLTPEKPNLPPASPNNKAVNLFLYEVKENRTLRDPVPFVTQVNNEYTQKKPPLRVDCSYLVTAWSKKTGEDKVKEEHELLALALAWLSSFPTIPEDYLEPTLTGGLSVSGQIYAPPTMVAQLDAGRNMGEFWSALGIPPRPYFNLVVTIAMDLNGIIARSAAVTTLTTRYQQGSEIATADERVLVGGRVLHANHGPLANAKPVVNAWVRVDETGETQVTNELGQFVFTSLQQGKPYVLRARAIGLGEKFKDVVGVPSPSGEYDIVFP